MTNVNVYEAKTKLSSLLNLVLQGEEVVISKAGVPLARLVPYCVAPARIPGRLKGQAKVGKDFFEPLPDDVMSFIE